MLDSFLRQLFNRPPQPLRALDHARPAGRADSEYTWYEVSPDDLYLRALAAIRLALATHEIPAGLGQYFAQAAQLPERAWELALVPRDQVAEADAPLRQAALELARKWFVEQLRQETGQVPIGIRILPINKERWRL